jgi:hypothetical protein
MIRYLKHNDIDREKWDQCIRNACFETIYPYSWYLDLVSPGWEGLVRGDYNAVFPLTWKEKFGITYLVQPVLTQQLGVFAKEKSSDLAVKSFLDNIPSKFRHIDISLNSSNELNSKEFKIMRRVNYELKMNKDIDTIRLEYSTNTKRNIRKALQNGLKIRNIGIKEYISLRQESDRKKFDTEHYQWLNNLFSGIIDKSSGELIGAFSNDKPCAAALWVSSKTRLIYLNAVSNKIGKENRAMFLMVDEHIGKNAGTDMVIDFEGSMIPGVARFFEGFGAKPEKYIRIRKSSFPFTLKKIK